MRNFHFGKCKHESLDIFCQQMFTKNPLTGEKTKLSVPTIGGGYKPKYGEEAILFGVIGVLTLAWGRMVRIEYTCQLL